MKKILLFSLILLLGGCKAFAPQLALPNPNDKGSKTYEEIVRKKARMQLKSGTESIKMVLTGDSIQINIIAPENARIKVKGRKKAKREHPNN